MKESKYQSHKAEWTQPSLSSLHSLSTYCSLQYSTTSLIARRNITRTSIAQYTSWPTINPPMQPQRRGITITIMTGTNRFDMENSTLIIILLFILIIHLLIIFYFYILNEQYHFTTMWLYARCDAIGSEQWHKIKAILENKDISNKYKAVFFCARFCARYPKTYNPLLTTFHATDNDDNA